jgi:hypothetical protein
VFWAQNIGLRGSGLRALGLESGFKVSVEVEVSIFGFGV